LWPVLLHPHPEFQALALDFYMSPVVKAPTGTFPTDLILQSIVTLTSLAPAQTTISTVRALVCVALLIWGSVLYQRPRQGIRIRKQSSRYAISGTLPSDYQATETVFGSAFSTHRSTGDVGAALLHCGLDLVCVRSRGQTRGLAVLDEDTWLATGGGRGGCWASD